jgi:hypothetical protein
MEIGAKAPSPLNAEFAKAGSGAQELRAPRKGISLLRWTPSDEQLLVKMRDAGHSWKAISKALPNNRSERAVESHWREMEKASRMISTLRS